MTKGTGQAASYAHGAGTVPLLGETIGASLERTAARVPDSDALVSCHQEARFSWAELNSAVDRLARGLLGLGLAKGDRLGVWSPNRYEWALVQYATAKLGVILVNINPAYRTSELEYALRQSGCRVLVAAPDFKGADYRAMVEGVRDGLPALAELVFFDSPEWDELAAGERGPGEGKPRARMDELDFDDPINIQYTSGTTGRPKGATLTHHNILNNALLQSGILGYTEADRVCIPVPLYHCFGMVLGNLACSLRGACIVYPEAAFDPLATLEAVAGERCTSLYGVPTMFIAELDHPRFSEFDLSSLRTGIMAGSPCPIEVMQRVGSEMGVEEMTIAFGMTETSPASTMVRRDDTLEHRCGTVGQAMPHTEIKIVDPVSNRTVARGESGEFRTRGYLVMSGYWDDPERTAEAVDSAGWMHTGDLATIDEEGYVRIVGRIKDMIIRGGENVYPREIEEFLYSHPAVADVQVVGVPDERYGEEIMAWVIA
ncbi:MAG: AMP-binding protein, partial [Actinomycetota bacterium]